MTRDVIPRPRALHRQAALRLQPQWRKLGRGRGRCDGENTTGAFRCGGPLLMLNTGYSFPLRREISLMHQLPMTRIREIIVTIYFDLSYWVFRGWL